MKALVQYYIFLLLLIALTLHKSNGRRSLGQPQQFPEHSQVRQGCCRTDNYIGLIPPEPENFGYRYEKYQNYPRIYQEGYHSKHNQYNYDRRYVPPKYPSYSKDFYRKRYNHVPPYVQRRMGYGVLDDRYINRMDLHRPYTTAEDGFNFRHSQINYRTNINEKNDIHNHKQIQSDPNYRERYNSELLLSFVTDRPGTIIVTDPDGIKHRVHSISLKEIELYESDKPSFSAPGSGASIKDDLDISNPSRGFSDEHNKTPLQKEQFHLNNNVRAGATEGYKNDSHVANINKYSMQNNRYYIDSSNIRFPSDEKTPHWDDFHPSPPFHKYSEPDPLFHPNGSPLQIHTPQTVTSSPVTATPYPTPRRKPSYPDSINAQLPPTSSSEDTQVPYVIDQVHNIRFTSETQATEVTQQKPSSIQIVPTIPSSFSNLQNKITSSTPQRSENPKKWDFLPTVQEASSSPIPQVLNNKGSNSPFIPSTESNNVFSTMTSVSTPPSTVTPESKSFLSSSEIATTFVTSTTNPEYFEQGTVHTVRNDYDVKQEATSENLFFAQRYINTTVTESSNLQTAATNSEQPDLQTEKHVNASVPESTTIMENTESVTKQDEYNFSAVTTATLNEETVTTTAPDVAHTY